MIDDPQLDERVQQAIRHRVETGSNVKFDEQVKKDLENHFFIMMLREPDSRPGTETYGYENEESVRSTLEYIEDRWNCTFRIRWLLDGLKNGYI